MKQRTRLGAMALVAMLAWAAPMSMVDAAPATDKPSKPGKLKFKQKSKPPKPVEQPVPGSVLTASEMALDCKKMAGRIKIRILENRGPRTGQGASAAAQGLQSATVPIFGGSQRGADAAADRSNDIAKIKAMNDILVSKGCPHYDINAELAKDAGAPSPSLIKASGAKVKNPTKVKAKAPAGKSEPAGKAATVTPPKS